MTKSKQFETPKRRQPFFSFIKKILRPFYRKPKRFINLAGELKKKSIIVVNHSAKAGPMGMEMYFPLFTVKWGAHEMMGNYHSRRRYLRDVFYMQKKGYGRVRAGFLAAFEAIFSKMIYKGVKVIKSYQDARLLRTLRESETVLNDNAAVLVFPENSNGGYLEEMTEFHPGFVLLAQYYYQRTGEDVPVYPCYYHVKNRAVAVGEPMSVNKMLSSGFSKEQVAEIFKDKVNSLLYKFCRRKVKA